MSQSITWPSAGDYCTAIQNPQNCFADPELQQGRATTNALGLPIGASGNFAVVFQLHCGARVVAARCFVRPVTDQRRRYELLSQHLNSLWLPSMVSFRFLEHGICVQGQWFPIVCMEWVAGRQFHRSVESRLSQPDALAKMAAQWRGLVASLRGAVMAHGDLQHGNILIDGNEQIRLVDYDGFFIPSLRRDAPGENGLPNYQHPERVRDGFYEEDTDNFSAVVIYLSLVALRAEPGLWNFHNGDNLIFVADDYAAPGKTPIWSRLAASPDAGVRRLASELAHLCRGPVAATPTLETILQGLPHTTSTGQGSGPKLSWATLTASLQPASRKADIPATHQAPMRPRATSHPLPSAPSQAICSACHHTYGADEIYCQSCAQPLAASCSCPQCGHSIPQNARYCPKCGHRI